MKSKDEMVRALTAMGIAMKCVKMKNDAADEPSTELEQRLQNMKAMASVLLWVLDDPERHDETHFGATWFQSLVDSVMEISEEELRRQHQHN